MLDDYFKTNPGVKDLPWPGIEPQSPSPLPVVIALSYNELKGIESSQLKMLETIKMDLTIIDFFQLIWIVIFLFYLLIFVVHLIFQKF